MAKERKDAKQKEVKISSRKLVTDFRVLSHRILDYANRGVLRFDFMHEVTSIMLDFSECDEVELRMKAHGKYYRLRVNRDSRKKHIYEIMDCQKNGAGEFIACMKDNSWAENLCRYVLLDEINNYLPYFTKNGSYWTGNMESTINMMSEKRAQKYDINQEEKFRSLSLIPLVEENKKIGIIILKGKKENCFTEEAIDFYEDLAKTIIVAESHRMAQVGLRERVKELTCLYGISRLAEQSDTSVVEILRGIVELLPPAWLHPEIACARIVLNGESFKSKGFKPGLQKQKANIVVEGENRGHIEIVYTAKKIELDEGPFLKEERKLIDSLAREIALIIEERKADEDRIKLEEQLRHADRLATIGQLSAGVAHELNEPLANILGFSQLIKKSAKLPKQVKEDIEKIERSSLHAREVIKKLMIFARQMPPQKTEVNLNKIAEEGLYFLESRCAKESIRVERSLAPSLPKITVDPSQMTQLIVNLVVNAIQAMPKGGKLLIQTINHCDYISIIVEDTGIGMSKDVLSKLFIPFFTTKDVSKGTGLGLSVVHGIVTAHGGTIEVKSKVGHGSRFEVRFPRAEIAKDQERNKDDKKT